MNLINFIKFGTEIKPLMSTLNPSKIELIKSMLIELYLRLLLAHLNLKEKKRLPTTFPYLEKDIHPSFILVSSVHVDSVKAK